MPRAYGCRTHVNRDQNYTIPPKIIIVYMPVPHQISANPITIETSRTQAKKLSVHNDQELYVYA